MQTINLKKERNDMQELRDLLYYLHNHLTDEDIGEIVGHTKSAVQKLRTGTTKNITYDQGVALRAACIDYIKENRLEPPRAIAIQL